MAQRTGIIVVPPALRQQQDRGPDERGEVVGHVHLTARVLQAGGHPAHDAAPFQDLAHKHRTGITRQPLDPALDPKRPVETGGDRLWSLTHACLRYCRRFLSSSLNLQRFQTYATNSADFRE